MLDQSTGQRNPDQTNGVQPDIMEFYIHARVVALQ